MTWTSQCAARDADSGKRCCLLAGHDKGDAPTSHATPRGAFSVVLPEGAIASALRQRLELAATMRPLAGAEGGFVDGRAGVDALQPLGRRRAVQRYRQKKAGLRAGRVQAGRPT